MSKISRKISEQIDKWLFREKVIVIIGARQVGKTTLLKEKFKNNEEVLWLNADEQRIRDRLLNPSINDIENVIGNYKTVIIDEVQRIANAGLLLKLMVDNFKGIQFIATGSSALEISDHIFEPLTGRLILFHLFPFCMAELYVKESPFEVEESLNFHLIYGSYPEISLNKADAKTLLKNLSQQYLYKDVLIWKDIRKPELLDKLLKLLAYQIGSEVSTHELANALKVKSETVESYIDLLEKSFVIFRLNSYATNPRKEVQKMSKIFFWDNGIRNAIIGNFNDLVNRNDQGALFENFVISERIKKNVTNNSDANSFFWRNYNQSEVDYVEVENNQLLAIEIKWNARKNNKVSRAFTNAYPEAETEVITPENLYVFLF